MAAGRHGGYRDSEYREREEDCEVSKRDNSHAKGEFRKIRNGDSAYERGRVHDRGMRDRDRVRQKDIRERDVINGGYRSAQSGSDSGTTSGGGGPRRCGFSVRVVDREPGELSSDSGSDEAFDPELLKKNEALKVQNGNRSHEESKKRKFSPIVWDRDDKEVSNTSNSRIAPAITPLPPPPPLPKSYRQSPNVIRDWVVEISPLKDGNVQCLEPSLDKPLVELASPVDVVSESPVDLPQEQQGGNFQESEQLEDEVYFSMRNISASRWADDANLSADEGEIYDEEMPRRTKKLLLSKSEEMKVSLTSERGELKRDGSEGTRASLSDSDGSDRIRSSSRDDCPADDSDKNDYMDIGEERDKSGSSSHSDTDSADEHGSRDTPEPVVPPQRTVNMLKGCRTVDDFERLNRIDEGTYGVVYRARDVETGEIVALKKVKMEKEREGFPLTSLREINILLSFHHPSIVDVKEVVVGRDLDSIFMVMEYMEHDLKGLMETMKQPYSQSEVKCLMLQLLEGVKYLHDNWVLHRDLKTSNLLLNNKGELKICDFGLARQYGSPLKPYTHLVVTLWYRAPELLLGAKQYSTAIDMWSLGCIMSELLSKEPLFNGKTEFDQLDKIFRILGTPNETIWPGFSKLPGVKVNFIKHQLPALSDSGLAFWPSLVTVSVTQEAYHVSINYCCIPFRCNLLRRKFPVTSFTGSPVLSDAGFDLLNKLLTYDPEKRITAEDALSHEWFREVPLPKSKEFMPTFPAQHAQDRRLRRIMKSPDPLEEQRRRELQQGELGTGGLFG
ncbi:Cyclin-dependent kinase [Actinidia chinensis var. chinensis]|uniref:cyclin-dependent kinase n=1 Tax=Actinidia chinensis var. chinensis TaxID=1590841 RepID=A0A2R6P3C3_ACTCC|nr:Cyclin-dependent kinase [Actinidia chinensis var. chinensis]